jgi:hypothetical protein
MTKLADRALGQSHIVTSRGKSENAPRVEVNRVLLSIHPGFDGAKDKSFNRWRLKMIAQVEEVLEASHVETDMVCLWGCDVVDVVSNDIGVLVQMDWNITD